MPFPTLTRLRLRFLPLATGLAALGGCGTSGDQTLPPCPAVSILGDAADLTRYRSASQDIIDMVLAGRITGLSGTCKLAKDGKGVLTTVNIGRDLTRAAAAPARAADASFFVALTKGDEITSKQVFPLHVQFPPNTDRVRLSGDQIEVQVPNAGKGGAAAYRVLVGFELTPQELATNRKRAPR